EDEGVERVAVLAQRALDEPVVGRVLRRGEQGPVQADPAGVVVHLVLVAAALGDLDGDVEVHGSLLLVSVRGWFGRRPVGRPAPCLHLVWGTASNSRTPVDAVSR